MKNKIALISTKSNVYIARRIKNILAPSTEMSSLTVFWVSFDSYIHLQTKFLVNNLGKGELLFGVN